MTNEHEKSKPMWATIQCLFSELEFTCVVGDCVLIVIKGIVHFEIHF